MAQVRLGKAKVVIGIPSDHIEAGRKASAIYQARERGEAAFREVLERHHAGLQRLAAGVGEG